MKKLLIGMFLISCNIFATPQIKIFWGEDRASLESRVNGFIYARRSNIKIIDIKYQVYGYIGNGRDSSLVLIYDRK